MSRNAFPCWQSDVRIVICPICEYVREVYSSVVVRNVDENRKQIEKLRNRKFEGQTQLCERCR